MRALTSNEVSGVSGAGIDNAAILHALTVGACAGLGGGLGAAVGQFYFQSTPLAIFLAGVSAFASVAGLALCEQE